MAIGAAGVIRVVNRLAEEGKIISKFEIPENVGVRGRERYMDIQTDDGVLYEVKGWSIRYGVAISRLAGGINPITQRTQNFSAQLKKDIISVVLDPNIEKVWVFADDALELRKTDIVDELLASIRRNEGGIANDLQALLQKNATEFFELLNHNLEPALNKLMGL